MAADDIFSEDDETKVVVAGMVAQGRERLLHVEAGSFGHHPFGLLDDDPAVEGVLA
jgi:hypothetical protein